MKNNQYRRRTASQQVSYWLRSLANWIDRFERRSVLHRITRFVEKCFPSKYTLEIPVKNVTYGHSYEESPVWKRLITGTTVELKKPVVGWQDYVLEDMYSKRVHCMMEYYNGNLRFKKDE